MLTFLKSLFSDVWSLFFPPVCPMCGGELGEGMHFVCTACRVDTPLTGFARERYNPLYLRIAPMFPVEQASALFFFISESRGRRLVHSFKYRGAWRTAYDMGCWYGAELAASGLYDDVDVVVPVPLHLRKLLRRGYNQSDYIASGVAEMLGVDVDRHSVVRCRNNPSQASSRKSLRWANVSDIFAVRRATQLEGRHILLVDDVFTTGATIISCAETILNAVPDCRISIAVLSVSQRELGVKG